MREDGGSGTRVFALSQCNVFVDSVISIRVDGIRARPTSYKRKKESTAQVYAVESSQVDSALDFAVVL
jgi:hypothetical protein